jgi:hypothetical protein
MRAVALNFTLITETSLRIKSLHAILLCGCVVISYFYIDLILLIRNIKYFCSKMSVFDFQLGDVAVKTIFIFKICRCVTMAY